MTAVNNDIDNSGLWRIMCTLEDLFENPNNNRKKRAWTCPNMYLKGSSTIKRVTFYRAEPTPGKSMLLNLSGI